MQSSDKTARQLFAEVKANPTRKRFGFGRMPALINVDPQKAYTCVGEFATAYETDPRQLEYINALAAEFRGDRTEQFGITGGEGFGEETGIAAGSHGRLLWGSRIRGHLDHAPCDREGQKPTSRRIQAKCV